MAPVAFRGMLKTKFFTEIRSRSRTGLVSHELMVDSVKATIRNCESGQFWERDPAVQDRRIDDCETYGSREGCRAGSESPHLFLRSKQIGRKESSLKIRRHIVEEARTNRSRAPFFPEFPISPRLICGRGTPGRLLFVSRFAAKFQLPA